MHASTPRHHPAPSPHMPARPQPAQRKRAPWLLLGGVVFVGAIAMMCAITVVIALLLTHEDTIAADVRVAGINVGGLALNEAESTLQTTLSAQSVTMIDGVRRWEMSFAQLGMQADLQATLALLTDAVDGASVIPRYTLDLNQTQRALVDLSAHTNRDAIPGRDATPGRALDIPATLDRIRANPLGELSDGEFELVMIVVEPPVIDNLETYTGEQTTHTVQAGQELALIAKEYGVDMADILALNEISNADVIYPGQQLVIPANGTYIPTSADAPTAPLSSGKSIVVDTATQRIYAYEDGALLRSHLVSTGRDATPTLKGDYNIYIKLRADDMSGPGYFVPQVPWTMYYYQGYAIHGAYWHNSFGRPMSHGCVNLPTDEAEWFFNWAEVGTLVRVI